MGIHTAPFPPQQGPHLRSAVSGSGTRPRAHTYAQISGSIKDSQKSTGYPNWVHFYFLRWGCPKDLRSIYTHFFIGRGLLHCQKSLRFTERNTGCKRTPAEPRVSRGPMILSSTLSTTTFSQVWKWERAESKTYEHPRELCM